MARDEHVCGLRGFGAVGDQCRACEVAGERNPLLLTLDELNAIYRKVSRMRGPGKSDDFIQAALLRKVAFVMRGDRRKSIRLTVEGWSRNLDRAADEAERGSDNAE